ncbi:MAG: 4-hydroxy-3-methylbut-2-enyl diphosphate reductase [Acholeplasmatales bacterium]|nr:4-hydroxy-3-methylbut-2-enyl diphosphate reductase [Acholeplasmatales bacterium]
MKVEILNPHGYCAGVKRAIQIALDASNNTLTKRPIYLLGNLIHNKQVTSALTSKGIITIEEKNRTRLQMLDDIESGTVIFSAHGISNKVREKAKSKGLNIIDASCGKVLIIHKKVLEYLEKGYEIIYIGKAHHPECEAILEESDHIHLITKKSDINLLNINCEKIYVTNQTTLSSLETKEIYDTIQAKYPKAYLDNNICNATTLRQNAILNAKGFDLCIVVGDVMSSNSKRLCEIANSNNMASLLVETSKDLTDDIKKYNNILLTSGASTPEEVLNDVYNHLINM